MEPTDSFAASNSRSPRRELQGPRPAPLRVRKDSHKIKKPPTMPGQPAPPPRQPVIIYTVSPTVIHAEPSNFMSIVQQLTGFNRSSSSSSNVVGGGRGEAEAVSPAARMAVQAATAASEGERQRRNSELATSTISGDLADQFGMLFDRNALPPPGILSPVPTALPSISPAFFSPAGFEPNYMGLYHDFSPMASGSFLTSTSPGTNWDPFNQF